METARFLVENGADLMWRNHEGLTVCHALIIPTPLLSETVPASSLT
jgi:hypothetical protein